MPLLVILLIAAMVASFGFWDTVQAILGAIGAIMLVVALGIGVIVAMAAWLASRAGRSLRGR